MALVAAVAYRRTSLQRAGLAESPAWAAAPLPRLPLTAYGVAGTRAGFLACAAKKKEKGGGGGGEAEEEAPEIDTEALMNDFEAKFTRSVETLQENLAGLRAGKATPEMLNEVKVSAYDTDVNIKEIASISVADARTLAVTCYDAKLATSVEKALIIASMGYVVSVDGATVKVKIPEMTKDKRTEYVKMAKEYAEKSRVGLRNVRATAMKKIKGLSKDLSEDIAKRMEKDIDATVKKMNTEIDNMFKKKEKELLTL